MRSSLWWRILAAWTPAAAWAGVLFALSALPGSQIPGPELPGSDKAVHAAVYAVLAALCFRGVRRTTALGRGRALCVAILIAGAYGATDELHQTLVPDRSADLRDLLADGLGAAAGALAAAALSLRRRRRDP